MNEIRKSPVTELAEGFIPPEFLPPGKDEYYLRERQNPSGNRYRGLSAQEIEILVHNHNTAGDWNKLLVSEEFNPSLVKNCKFFGLVRIGKLEPLFLEFHDLRLPVGLYDSTIINCDLGDNVVVDHVNYMAFYITGNEVIISNVHELSTSNHSKFGNGILKEGEPEDVRIKLEICNENGGRSVLPFDGMLAGDAWMWSRNRHNTALQRRFREMTEMKFDNLRGYYGSIGDRTVIKNTSIIKDVKTGTDTYIKGANKLKNLTINSCAEAPTQIGEGCELVNGIIGKGCRIFYGVKAVRFILGSNSQLKYGARLINSFLGDNSTISCCEVLNSLIFPGHEQHHNNSFLIASTLLGQSNVAAGATLGSNHNSRAADGELEAGRGFWPGLSTSLKHNSRFAPFTLLAKADYNYEMDIPFPFSLVSNDASENRLVIMPAYWLRYNMYALVRNAWKYKERDNRPEKTQYLETAFLAPDSINAIIKCLPLLEKLLTDHGLEIPATGNRFPDTIGTGSVLNKESALAIKPDNLVTFAIGFENSTRKCLISKAQSAYAVYQDTIFLYAMQVVTEALQKRIIASLSEITGRLKFSVERREFVNIGGQLIPENEYKTLINRITEYEIVSWDQIHEFYALQSAEYPAHKLNHAIACLQYLGITDNFDIDILKLLFRKFIELRKDMVSNIQQSRLKDYRNPFRKMMYVSDDEMHAVLGIPENAFIKAQVTEYQELDAYIRKLLE